VEIGSPQEKRVRERIEPHGGYELMRTVHDGTKGPRVLRVR
jgi:hypothetical protein